MVASTEYILYYIFTDLQNAFERCTSKPHPKSIKISKVYDIKKWLQPHSVDLHNHVQPHCFKFVRNEKECITENGVETNGRDRFDF